MILPQLVKCRERYEDDSQGHPLARPRSQSNRRHTIDRFERQVGFVVLCIPSKGCYSIAFPPYDIDMTVNGGETS